MILTLKAINIKQLKGRIEELTGLDTGIIHIEGYKVTRSNLIVYLVYEELESGIDLQVSLYIPLADRYCLIEKSTVKLNREHKNSERHIFESFASTIKQQAIELIKKEILDLTNNQSTN